MNTDIDNSFSQPARAMTWAGFSGLTMTAELVPFSRSRNAKEKRPSLNWRVTVKAPHTELELVTDYMQGVGHLPNYSHKYATNAAYDDTVRAACETGVFSPPEFAGSSRFKTGKVSPPKLVDVLYSLVMDASALEYASFEDWASEYGYDADSRSAERTYQDCLKIALKLQQMVDLPSARIAFEDF